MAALKDYQIDAINRMKNGCILCGGVGSGKSRTALGYFRKFCEDYGKLLPLYIITTARKRDTHEWEDECPFFNLSGFPTVDSWNNIAKYTVVKGAFFIFDEQRVVGSGVWVKSFLTIAKNNTFVLLSATPGDKWEDYIPIFIANGFYKNRSDFITSHIVYKRFSKFPQVDYYINTGRLMRHRNDILVDMDFKRKTESVDTDVTVEYNKAKYKEIMKSRYNIWEDRPIMNAGELCYALRRVVNSDEDRLSAVLDICSEHKKVIIFYNFDYELGFLKSLAYELGTIVAEWNGHKHELVPDSEKFVYLVQYTAGAEGWNCTLTDTVIFYSQTYSYKTLVQAKGRIDRMNTPFSVLYYYHLLSKSPIDISIRRALKDKKAFNAKRFAEKYGIGG